MIARCRKAGLGAPRFRQNAGQFVQTIPRATMQVTTDVTPEVEGKIPRSKLGFMPTVRRGAMQVTMQVTMEVAQLLSALSGEMTRQQLQRALRPIQGDRYRRRAACAVFPASRRAMSSAMARYSGATGMSGSGHPPPNRNAKFAWSSPSQLKEPVPQSQLSPPCHKVLPESRTTR